MKVAIGVLVSALLMGIYWLVVTALKVPELETQLKKHEEQLTTIRINLLALMQKTGNPPDPRQLEKLISGVYELGEIKAASIKQARLEKGTGKIIVGEWAPKYKTAMYAIDVHPDRPLVDKLDIGHLISAAMISDVPAKWTVAGSNLKLDYGKENVFTFIPSKNVSSNDLELMAAELNSLKIKLEELKKATPTTK
jgi:hypothetical protein